MGVVGGGDVNGVHIRAVNQVMIIGKAMGGVKAVCFPRVFHALGLEVTHSGQLQVWAVGNAGQVHALGNSPNAYAANAPNFLFHGGSS
jgi:hypothetical protein